MSVRRFIGYFVALSACSTVAFASFLIGHADAQSSLEMESPLPPLHGSPAHLHGHKSGLKHTQVALAE